jgi:hypothetical protein
LLYSKVKLEAYLQPVYTIEENGSFTEEGDYRFSIHRARTSLEFSTTKNQNELFGKLSTEFTEKEVNEILKSIYGGINIKSSLLLTMGQFKSSFGYESAISSKKVPFIYRGEISNYVRKSLDISGYLLGAKVEGRFVDEKLSVIAEIFNNSGFDVNGGGSSVLFKDMFALPIFTVSYSALKNLKLKASFAIPYIGTLNSEYSPIGSRYFFSDYSAIFNTGIYTGEFEFFLGEDTASTKELLKFTSDDNIGVSQGILFSNSFKISIKENYSTMLSGRFEYLNGLSFDGITYTDRPFYYTLTFGARFSFKNKYYAEFNYSDKFDDSFTSSNDKLIAFQITTLLKKTL